MTPRICLITPTRNRPVSFELLERWVSRQQVWQPDQWIVVNDGQLKYKYTRGQLVVTRKSQPGEGHSLPINLLEAIPLVDADVVFIAEDDDWWAADYLHNHMRAHMEGVQLVGNKPSRHYNLQTRRFNTFERRWCNLGSTSFLADQLDVFEDVCSRQAENHTFNVDVAFWGEKRQVVSRVLPSPLTGVQHVGLKGMPGEPGLGMGHRVDYGTLDFPQMDVLRQWIGKEDWNVYRQISAGAFNI